MALRTALRAPSQPTTYRAFTVSMRPAWPASERSIVTVTGKSAAPRSTATSSTRRE
jgi:hypothetical protein